MISVVLVGTGQVAMHLFKAFYASQEVQVVQVIGRSTKALLPFEKLVNTTFDYNNVSRADIYIIAVSDGAISAVSQRLKINNKLIVHTSGSTPLTALSPHVRKGVFYPLQTFSSHRNLDTSSIPFCLETEQLEDYSLLENLARTVSKKIYPLNSEQRKIVHLAAVYVNNFTNHMYFIGHEFCEKAEVPFDILKPLILETAKKIEQLPPFDAQTGPAKRNDKDTSRRLEELIQDNLQKDIFAIVTKSIETTYDQEL